VLLNLTFIVYLCTSHLIVWGAGIAQSV
jgi:hypothetical protein